ncbi:MAG: response regulator [Lachnospiraceae bacterium]|nr:response regulator [Lachnospiraceae bacterium]
MEYRRILVVDDVEINLQLLSVALEHLGLAADTAISGKRALERLGEREYDLILLDHRMPEMDGAETIRHIRRLPVERYHTLPILCLSGDPVADDGKAYREMGYTDYLGKPVDPRQLREMLERYLPGWHGREQDSLQKEHPIFQKLEKLPGMNAPSGLAHCGSEEDYLNALRIFVRSIEKKTRELERLLKAQDWEMLGLKVHALKSVAGAVGAEQLAGMAAALERERLAGETELLPGHTRELLRVYRSMREPLEALLKKDISREELEEGLRTLEELLGSGDLVSAGMVLDSLWECNLPEELRGRLQQLEEAVKTQAEPVALMRILRG